MRNWSNEKEIAEIEWADSIKNKSVLVSPHATAHLVGKQRKAFKEEELILIIERTVPRLVLLQENGRYAAYYRQPTHYMKIIIEMHRAQAVVVTFMTEKELPRRNAEEQW